MLILLSPAKSLDFEPKPVLPQTQPKFKPETLELASIMKEKSTGDLKKLMSISDKLADLNYQRYQQFSESFTRKNSKQAFFAFTGDVYQGLEAASLTEHQLEYAQEHVRMLSGLYGILRPFDVIQPYRLEMGTKLPTGRGKNLYDFWGDKIALQINKELKNQGSRVLINLASNEYFKAVDRATLKAEIYEIDFRELRGDEYKFISFNAKKARGFMTQYIVRKRLKDPEKIKGFDMEGYHFNEDLSKDKHWVFTR
jgi:cytoplasmic iron level regulating protein YaaA (DUF328/UPF0246 family)